jgi:hypothetical protein
MPTDLTAGTRYISIASGATAIINLRPAVGVGQPNAFVIYLNGGTATYQPCDFEGTVVPGSSSVNAVSGEIVAAAWPFYKVVATGAACVVGGVAAMRATLESDVEIGAVELKDATSTARAKIGALSGLASSDNGVPVAAYGLASENHLGEVGSNTRTSYLPITTDTAAYTAGDSIFGKWNITNAVRNSGGTSILQSLVLTDVDNQKPTGILLLFGSNPADSTITDQAAVVLHENDMSKIIGHVAVTSADWKNPTAARAVATITSIGLVVAPATGTQIWGAFILDNAPDFTSATALTALFGFLRD